MPPLELRRRLRDLQHRLPVPHINRLSSARAATGLVPREKEGP